jgi:hypothetical protein
MLAQVARRLRFPPQELRRISFSPDAQAAVRSEFHVYCTRKYEQYRHSHSDHPDSGSGVIFEQYNDTTGGLEAFYASDLESLASNDKGMTSRVVSFVLRELACENGVGVLTEILTKEYAEHEMAEGGDARNMEQDETGEENDQVGDAGQANPDADGDEEGGGGTRGEGEEDDDATVGAGAAGAGEAEAGEALAGAAGAGAAGAESAHLIIGDPRPELPVGWPPRWIAPATNDLVADDQSGNQVPEGWPPGWAPAGLPPGWMPAGWVPAGWPPESRFDGEDEVTLRSGERDPPVADDQSGDRQGSEEHDGDQDVEGQKYRGAAETPPQRLTLTPGGQRKREPGPPTSPAKQGQAHAKSPPVAVEGFVHRKGGLLEKIQVIRPRQRETDTPPK